MKKTISILVYNESGVLTRISTVFSSRGFNIDSITVGPTENYGVSKIILVILGDNQAMEQIIKQLNKLIQVIEIKDLTNLPCVERELMLIKIGASEAERGKIIEVAQIFRAHIVDVSDSSLTIEASGDPGKIAALYELLKKYKVLQVVRTGKISIERSLGINSEVLKNT